MAGEESERFNELLGRFEELDAPNDYGFDLVRKWPGLAFAKELYEVRREIIMLEISDVYARKIVPRHLYVGKTDFDAGTPEKRLFKYQEAELFNKHDLDSYNRNTPIFVRNEEWSSSYTGESGIWTGLKIWTRGERKIMWGFEFNAEWG